MKNMSDPAPAILKALLDNFTDQRIPPSSIGYNEETGSIVIGVASKSMIFIQTQSSYELIQLLKPSYSVDF